MKWCYAGYISEILLRAPAGAPQLSLFYAWREVSILRNDEDAEDAVSEATVKAYINFGRLRKPGSFKYHLDHVIAVFGKSK